jgi:hypothetical protein
MQKYYIITPSIKKEGKKRYKKETNDQKQKQNKTI